MTKCTSATDTLRHADITCLSHTHTQISVMLGKGEIYFIDLEQIRKVGRTSGRYCTDAKRRSFVFDSRIDWKPVQSLKMKCTVVFQEERIFPGAFKMRGAALFWTFLSPIRKYWGYPIQRGGSVQKFCKQKYCSLNLWLVGVKTKHTYTSGPIE